MTEIPVIPELQIAGAALTAAAAGISSVQLYLKMPAGWVCDAGEMPRTCHQPSMRRQMTRSGNAAGTGWAAALCAAAVFLFLIHLIAGDRCPVPAPAAAYVLALTALCAASQADSTYLILPDQLTAFILAAGLFSGLAADLSFPGAERGLTADFPFSGTVRSVTGALTGFLIMLLCAGLSLLISGRQGVGAGDIKLAGACGALTGAENVPFLIFLASSGAACSALRDIFRKKYIPHEAKPAGPWFFTSVSLCLILF